MAEMPPDERTTLLFVVCFHGLDPQIKCRFGRLLASHQIDLVIHGMQAQGLFPDWAADEMTFDPLHYQINDLRRKLSSASRDLLIRRDFPTYDYHFDNMEPDELNDLRERIGLDPEYVAGLIRHMNQRLLAAA